MRHALGSSSGRGRRAPLAHRWLAELYTLDAPPPWGSTNGEIIVNAGDAYYFPIRPQ